MWKICPNDLDFGFGSEIKVSDYILLSNVRNGTGNTILDQKVPRLIFKAPKIRPRHARPEKVVGFPLWKNLDETIEMTLAQRSVCQDD